MRPVAHSLVSGLDEQPYAYDSNPRQTESVERAAELPSLQPIRYKKESIPITFGTSTYQVLVS